MLSFEGEGICDRGTTGSAELDELAAEGMELACVSVARFFLPLFATSMFTRSPPPLMV